MTVTLKDVAIASGVSWQVVASVLNGKGSARSSEATRARIRKVAAEMGYKPHGPARSLATGRTRMIEVQAHAAGAESFHMPLHHLPIWAGVVQYCQRQGYNAVLRTTNDLKGEGLTRNVAARNVDALVLIGVDDEAVLHALSGTGVPQVSIDSLFSVDMLADKGYSAAAFENAGGVGSAVAYLVSLGHSNIGYVKSSFGHADFVERWAAFQKAMSTHNLPIRDEWVWTEPPRLEGGEHVANSFLASSSRPTALLTSNDLQALGVLRRMQANGLSVPRDLSLIGFDDIQAVSAVWPDLTTVRLNWHGLAGMAAERLFEQLKFEDGAAAPAVPSALRYPVELIVRNSCARIGQSVTPGA